MGEGSLKKINEKRSRGTEKGENPTNFARAYTKGKEKKVKKSTIARGGTSKKKKKKRSQLSSKIIT